MKTIVTVKNKMAKQQSVKKRKGAKVFMGYKMISGSQNTSSSKKKINSTYGMLYVISVRYC